MPAKTYGLMLKPEMILAYKKGLKTQTRRLKGLEKINQNPDNWVFKQMRIDHADFTNKKPPIGFQSIRLPYGNTSSTLWFKETWAIICKVANPFCECDDEYEAINHYVEYRADSGNPCPGDWPEDECRGNDTAPKWRSSMFMPIRCSRFTEIPILDVRVERLHNIDEFDSLSEGIEPGVNSKFTFDKKTFLSARSAYAYLWDSINGKTFPWESNPWVFVYEFPKFKEIG